MNYDGQAILNTLINLSRATFKSKWSFLIMLLIYANGYVINKHIFLRTPFSLIWVFPEIAVGLVWVCFIGTVILAGTLDFFPLTIKANSFIIIACAVISAATLVILEGMVLMKRTLNSFFEEVHEIYGKDYRILSWVFVIGVGLVALLWWYKIVMKPARIVIKSISDKVGDQ